MVEIAPEVKAAYEEIRRPGSTTGWATFKYAGSTIVVDQTGTEHEAFLAALPEDAAVFSYYRLEVETEGTSRTKFVLITWIGQQAPPLKKGKVSVDKPSLKGVIKDLTVEIQTSAREDLTYDQIVQKVRSANY